MLVRIMSFYSVYYFVVVVLFFYWHLLIVDGAVFGEVFVLAASPAQ